MATEREEHPSEAPAMRATRCQLLLALLFLIGVSALGWYLVGMLL